MMYLDSRKNRVLLSNGISILDVDDYVEIMLTGGEVPPHMTIESSEDTKIYKMITGIDVGYDIDDYQEPSPPKHTHGLIDIDPDKYSRFDKMLDLYGEPFIDRLADEIEFFERENSELIHKLMNLIDRFKEDGVVWGVGRGSACASMLMYIIEVHDIDPIRFKIPFNELTKESGSEY